MPATNHPTRTTFRDPSLWLLLASNLAAIFFAAVEDWSLLAVMWVYWSQSVTIGIFNFVRILQLKEFSTKGLKINGQPAAATRGTKIYLAFFFLIHYGFFHAGYAAFLGAGTFAGSGAGSAPPVNGGYILLAALLFFGNHLFSYLYNRPRDTEKRNIGSLMFYPYARVIPMHLTIIFGSMFGGALVFFLALKTLADLIMHAVEHGVLRKGEAQD